jgi:uncharacterized membrane protein
MRIRQTAYIDRPAGDVFVFVADRANDPQWRTELEAHAYIDDPEQGGEARIKQVVSYQGRTTEFTLEVTDLVPDSRICFRVHGGARAHGCCDIAADGPGTSLGVSITVELKGEQVMLERYLRQALEGTMTEDLQRLKETLEGARGPVGA